LGFLLSQVALRLSVALDTEATGLDPLNGHRVVEIGTVELINRSPTGKTFHRYLCPQGDIPADAVAVHGLTAEFLADKPLFANIADEFLASVVDAPLVAHNANVRLEVVGMPKWPWSYEETGAFHEKYNADVTNRGGVDRRQRSRFRPGKAQWARGCCRKG